jgi:small basic protein (TIGR04137 family)
MAGGEPLSRIERGSLRKREISSFFGLPHGKVPPRFRPPAIFNLTSEMSKHNSLKSNATVGGKRSVLKRFERVKLLKERGEWKAGKSPVGLPKTKHEG